MIHTLSGASTVTNKALDLSLAAMRARLVQAGDESLWRGNPDASLLCIMCEKLVVSLCELQKGQPRQRFK